MALNKVVLGALMKTKVRSAMAALSDADKKNDVVRSTVIFEAMADAWIEHLQVAGQVTVVTSCGAGAGTGTGTIT